MGARIGPHIINSIGPHESNLKKWQPDLITVLDPNRDEMKALRQWCPNTTIVGRVYIKDSVLSSMVEGDPIAAAEYAHNKTMKVVTSDVDYWQVANEICQSYDLLDNLNDFEMERMRLADEAGYKCAIFGFSVGNPDMPEIGRMALWRQVYRAIEYAEAHDHVINLHQYGKPNLWRPDADWFIDRLEKQVIPRLPFKKVKFAVTEIGIDGLIWSADGKPRGWKEYTTPEDYASQLIRKGAEPVSQSDRVIGYSVFTLGHNSPWQTYDIFGEVADRLANHYASQQEYEVPQPEPKPELPPGGTPEPGKYSPRISDGAKKLNLVYNSRFGGHWRLKDLFTTANGSWEIDPHKDFGIEQWARDAYLSRYFDDAGGDHHLFARFEDKDGNALPVVCEFRTHDISDTRDTSLKKSGWQNIPLFGGSSFDPDIMQQGPWTWGPLDEPETYVLGGGLPWRHHVSSFAVFQEYDPEEGDESDEEYKVFFPNVSNGVIAGPDSKVEILLQPIIEPLKLPTVVTQNFGARPEYYKQFGLPCHEGTDYAAELGQDVYSIANGVVGWADFDPNYGNYIRVWHPQLQVHSFYAHCSSLIPTRGDAVTSGQVIAKAGSTGNSTGPHLHFEIRLAKPNGEYMDSPYEGMTKGRINPETWYEIQRRLQGGS
jgi:hypothetical protein